MKKLFSFVALFAIILVSVVTACPAASVGSILAIAPLATQKAVFLNVLKDEYHEIDTWLNEATDLSSFVVDGQTLKFPEGGAYPKVYKDRTEDVDSMEPTESVHSEDLNVYDTQNYKIRNIWLHALPFDKVQYYVKNAAEAIKIEVVKDGAYNIMPSTVLSNDKRVVIPATGTAEDGRKTICLADIKTLAKQCDNKRFFKKGRNLVLPSDMWWGLVNNNNVLETQISNQQKVGVYNPDIVEYCGIKIHKSYGDELGLTWDTSTNKKGAQGAVLTDTVAPCALFFCSDAIYRADGEFKMFYNNMENNPTGRADEFGYQHRQKTGHQYADQKYTGVIYLPKA